MMLIIYFFFFFYSCYNIAQMDGGFIANETYESVSRNFIESNEPTNDMGVIEEYEGEYSIENEFEPFVGQCFLSEEEAFIFYRNYANQHGFSIRKGQFVTKEKEKVRRDFFCH
jgi:hypothetical protein